LTRKPAHCIYYLSYRNYMDMIRDLTLENYDRCMEKIRLAETKEKMPKFYSKLMQEIHKKIAWLKHEQKQQFYDNEIISPEFENFLLNHEYRE